MALILDEEILPDPDYRGYHVLLDYVTKTFKTQDLVKHYKKRVSKEDASLDQMVARSIFKIMEDALIHENINIVHRKLVVLDGTTSPAGFTSVMLLDESHASAHCYSDMGLLAIDCFTCGGNPQGTRNVASFIHREIVKIFPDIESRVHTSHRFPLR